MHEKVRLICIDMQNDFTSEGGKFYLPRPSVDFARNVLFPFLEDRGIVVAEIASDYRQPRPGDDRDCCRPGEWGYESIVPSVIRNGRQWVKSMNSPVWTRNGIGDPSAQPGEPFPDPNGFGEWLTDHVGGRNDVLKVVLFGLTADCCVLSTVQELKWRGYDVNVLSEATDMRSGDPEEKELFLNTSPFIFWGSAIRWVDLQHLL
ncbi:MAG: isochorismatase family protein [Candidatus Thermoplasmatota archaeon]|nr:isochorismatase family protein [Candidatus Thermoplasmatota archaeon]